MSALHLTAPLNHVGHQRALLASWIKTTANIIVVVLGTVSKKLREVIRPGGVILDDVCLFWFWVVVFYTRVLLIVTDA